MAQFFSGGSEENNILNYPLGMFQVWFIREVYVVSYTMADAVLCFG